MDRGEGQSLAAFLSCWVTSGLTPVVERVEWEPQEEEQNDSLLQHAQVFQTQYPLSRALPAHRPRPWKALQTNE